MNEEQMRSILIYGNADTILLEKLKDLPTWKLEKLGISGAHEYCLSRGNDKVALSPTAPNVISTSNVLPHDNNDHEKANEVLKQLSRDLDEAGISNVISASDEDLA